MAQGKQLHVEHVQHMTPGIQVRKPQHAGMEFGD